MHLLLSLDFLSKSKYPFPIDTYTHTHTQTQTGFNGPKGSHVSMGKANRPIVVLLLYEKFMIGYDTKQNSYLVN